MVLGLIGASGCWIVKAGCRPCSYNGISVRSGGERGTTSALAAVIKDMVGGRGIREASHRKPATPKRSGEQFVQLPREEI